MEILESLNPQQKEAVVNLDGPMLILAGAGSGKTKTLTHRIAHALSSTDIEPENILAVTFTNKAANEMRERVSKLLSQSNHRGFMPFMGTFHGVCVKILRLDGEYIGLPSDFIIFDSQDAAAAVNQALKQHHIDTKRFAPKSVAAVLSSCKNELISKEDYALIAHTQLQKITLEIWDDYKRILTESKALDFDDLILKTVSLLQTNPNIRQKWQQQFRLLMVDEYQDTNTAQYQLIKLMVNKQHNLCVVGDDWQSIYSWRGADYRNILNFERDYPSVKIVKLEQNYRSTEAILNAAHKVISKNRGRSKKKLWTDKKSGTPVMVMPVADDRAEAEAIISGVQRSVADKSRTYKDFAVLYRTNAQSRSIEEQLIRYGIPYRVVGGFKFYDRKEIKDIIAYLRLIYQPDDGASFERVINVPARGLGAISLQKFMQWKTRHNLLLSQALARVSECPDLSAKAKLQFASFYHLIEGLHKSVQGFSVSNLLDGLLVKTDYLNYVSDGSIQGEARTENVKELISVTQEYRDSDLAMFLEEVTLISDIDSYDSSSDALTLMTLHSAKGLEFPVVFMIGMEEGLFPHSRALFSAEEMEEERRLCYVGMTRAMHELYLIYASSRLLYGNYQHNPPSRFISDIDEDVSNINFIADSSSLEPTLINDEYIKVNIGEAVRHPVFGLGEVKSLDDVMATIRFKNGSKTLNLMFAPLEKVD